MQDTAPRDFSSARHGFTHPPRNVVSLGIQPGMSIADFGSGSGVYVLLIAEALAHAGHIYAIDIQRDLLARTKNEAHRLGFKNVDIIWADLETPNASKISDKKLDLVLISNLLFQVEHKAAVLYEAWRILKPTGRLVIIDWRESPPAGGRQMGPQAREVVEKDAAQALAHEHGFAFIHEFPAGAHHYGLIFHRVSKK
jgi:ubiquinone/menaquinone biosynthesis C-methylase UbiE